MSKTTLYIATHKLFIPPKIFCYKPIAIGKKQNWLPYLKDNYGKNIAEKNPYYCELTALYWIWKNDCSEYVGLMHFHRYFYDDKYITKSEINILLEKYDMIVPTPILFDCNIYEQYKSVHYVKDLELACQEILKRDNTYKKAIEQTLNQHKFYIGNMFITSRDILEEYLDFLFPILFNLEQKIPYLQYSIYNKRVFGFLAERIFNIYVRKNNLHLKEYPIKDTLSMEEQNLKRERILKSLDFDNQQGR